MKVWFTLVRYPHLVIRMHYTWLLLLPLGIWSLAQIALPTRLGEEGAAWMTALLIAAVYVACVALHELGHVLAARLLSVPMPALNVHPIGTLARIGREEAGPARTFAVAAAGPFANLLLWLLLRQIGSTDGTVLAVVLDFARSFTLMLGLVNLLPGLPLDGGRMLRAALWHGGDFNYATRAATTMGYLVIGGIFIFGLRTLSNGETVLRGLWMVLLAWLIYAAGAALQRRRTVGALFNYLTVRDVMVPAPQIVEPAVTLRALAASWSAGSGESPTAVVENSKLVGLVTRSLANDVPQGYWDERTVAQAMQPIAEVLTATPATPLAQVLPYLDIDGFNPLPLLVVDEGRLLGVVEPRDVIPLVDVQEMFGMQHAAPPVLGRPRGQRSELMSAPNSRPTS